MKAHVLVVDDDPRITDLLRRVIAYEGYSVALAASGDEARADRARADVTAQTIDYQYLANIQLHQSMCTIVNGGIDQGARQAATVLHDLPDGYRSNMIVEVGKMVLRSVPMDSQHRPAVADLRDVLVTV